MVTWLRHGASMRPSADQARPLNTIWAVAEAARGFANRNRSDSYKLKWASRLNIKTVSFTCQTISASSSPFPGSWPASRPRYCGGVEAIPRKPEGALHRRPSARIVVASPITALSAGTIPPPAGNRRQETKEGWWVSQYTEACGREGEPDKWQLKAQAA